MTWHKNDKVMTKIVGALPKPKKSVKDDLYFALLDSVVGQQLSTKVADVIFARFLMLFKDSYPDAKKLTRMNDEKLRGIGLSAAKVKYVKSVAAHHLEKPITNARFSHLTDEEIIAELIQIKGVGLWTIQMMLMFAMDRPDVFAVGDLIIRQMMIKHYGLTQTGANLMRKLHEIAEAWAPQRTLACKYLWKSRDLVPAEAPKAKRKS